MKTFGGIFLTFWIMCWFGLLGYLISNFDLIAMAVGALIGFACCIIYYKLTMLENQIFELKELLKNKS